MACMCAALGLLPARLSNGIGAQAQQPLARVVVGGMVTTLVAVLFVLPCWHAACLETGRPIMQIWKVKTEAGCE